MSIELKELEVKSFGPIADGKLEKKKINIFVGPNNSGKSMTARLMHAFSRAYGLAGIEDRFFGDRFIPYYVTRHIPHKASIEDAYSYTIMRMISEEIQTIVTHGAKSSKITAHTNQGTINLVLSPLKDGFNIKTIDKEKIIEHLVKERRRDTPLRSSVYVPAARTGTIQFFNTVIYIRNRLLGNIISTFGGSSQAQEMPAQEIRRSLRSLGRFPLYLEDFYDLILESLAGGIEDKLQGSFKTLHTGSLKIQKTRGISSVYYFDPSGFATEIERAGSGVMASFPILLGLYRVAPKGTLIIEEPEAHLEPAKQMSLLELLCKTAADRDIKLVITTHSDYVLKKALAMVGKGQLSNEDIGLYYFERPEGKFTTIRKIEVDKTGEAEQPLFQEATEALIKEYAEPLLS